MGAGKWGVVVPRRAGLDFQRMSGKEFERPFRAGLRLSQADAVVDSNAVSTAVSRAPLFSGESELVVFEPAGLRI